MWDFFFLSGYNVEGSRALLCKCLIPLLVLLLSFRFLMDREGLITLLCLYSWKLLICLRLCFSELEAAQLKWIVAIVLVAWQSGQSICAFVETSPAEVPSNLDKRKESRTARGKGEGEAVRHYSLQAGKMDSGV